MADDLLVRLVGEAGDEGHDIARLLTLVEEASASGSRRAIEGLGLSDEAARRDLDELRELLRSWRDAKSSMFKGLVQWVFRVIVALVLMALAAKFGLGSAVTDVLMKDLE